MSSVDYPIARKMKISTRNFAIIPKYSSLLSKIFAAFLFSNNAFAGTGYEVPTNGTNPRTYAYQQEPKAACALLAQHPEYAIGFYWGSPPQGPGNFFDGYLDIDGTAFCFIRDAKADIYSFALNYSCEAGLTPQRGACVKDPDRGQADRCGSSPEAGNPMSLSASSKNADFIDFSTEGAQAFVVSRYYRSRGSRGNLLPGRWRFGWEYEAGYSGNGDLIVRSPQGQDYVFTVTSADVFESKYKDVPIKMSLDNVSGVYKYYWFTDEFGKK